MELVEYGVKVVSIIPDSTTLHRGYLLFGVEVDCSNQPKFVATYVKHNKIAYFVNRWETAGCD